MSTNRPCDLKAAVGGDGDRVTHLEIVYIWWSHRYERIKSTPSKPNCCLLVRGIISARRISLLLLWEPTGTCWRQIPTSPSWSLESMADKTENTKRVVSYCATICSSNQLYIVQKTRMHSTPTCLATSSWWRGPMTSTLQSSCCPPSKWSMRTRPSHTIPKGTSESQIPTPGDTGKEVWSLEILRSQHLIVSLLWLMKNLTTRILKLAKSNPNKFETCNDRVDQTSLTDASVFWDLKTRYQAKMLHTHAGLFVVFVNPPANATLSTSTENAGSILEKD